MGGGAVLAGIIILGLYWYFTQSAEQGNTVVDVTPNSKIVAIAQAINQAENSGDPSGGWRNNPGNIVDPATKLPAVYPDSATGWQKLYNKVDFDFVSGQSTVYSAGMTWQAVAWMWVAGSGVGDGTPHPGDNPDQWAAIVAARLGVSMTSTVQDYLAS